MYTLENVFNLEKKNEDKQEHVKINMKSNSELVQEEKLIGDVFMLLCA